MTKVKPTKKQIANMLIAWEAQTSRFNHNLINLLLYRIIIDDDNYEQVLPRMAFDEFAQFADDVEKILNIIKK